MADPGMVDSVDEEVENVLKGCIVARIETKSKHPLARFKTRNPSEPLLRSLKRSCRRE